jgi:hypothetical protein
VSYLQIAAAWQRNRPPVTLSARRSSNGVVAVRQSRDEPVERLDLAYPRESILIEECLLDQAVGDRGGRGGHAVHVRVGGELAYRCAASR